MKKLRTLSATQIEQLTNELAQEELSIYTVVRMARKDVADGHVNAALTRLCTDADKIRMHSKILSDIIDYASNNQDDSTNNRKQVHMYYF